MKGKGMKILYIAFECNPYRGSECAIGWSWPFFMRKYHEVYVLTRKEHKSDIEKYVNTEQLNELMR